MHGFMHPRNECKEWDKELADRLFTTVFDMKNRDGKPIFYKGFKAPSWGYNQATVDAARDHGLILGVNTDTSNSPGVVFHEDMKQYRPNGDFVTAKHRAGSLDRFHGHLEVPDCENDLRYYWHYLENRISVDAQFFFISEVVEGLYTKSS
jgi:peptidoglycan/xylan/chitin deacetylase (PgdA/CDA1 family)